MLTNRQLLNNNDEEESKPVQPSSTYEVVLIRMLETQNFSRALASSCPADEKQKVPTEIGLFNYDILICTLRFFSFKDIPTISLVSKTWATTMEDTTLLMYLMVNTIPSTKKYESFKEVEWKNEYLAAKAYCANFRLQESFFNEPSPSPRTIRDHIHRFLSPSSWKKCSRAQNKRPDPLYEHLKKLT